MRIYLIGFMGAGKSYWGKIWAEQLQLDWIDLDDVVEKKAGQSIEHIFNVQGENGFRKLEQACLHETARQHNFLCSMGGGTPCHENNMDWINAHGITVWLDASPELLANRLEADVNKRPLLRGKSGVQLLQQIQLMLHMRDPIYQQAQIRLNAETLHVDSLTELFNQHNS
jgi:shikimate kinase